jgi:hypothetical protein
MRVLFLMIFVVFAYFCEANAASIIVRPIQMDDGGLKIYFAGLDKDFSIDQKNAVVSITFDAVYKFEDLRLLKKFPKILLSGSVVSNVMIMKLSDKSLIVETFQEKTAKGIVIYNKKVKIARDAANNQNEKLNISVVKDEKGFDKIKFAFQGSMQAAAFIRAGYLWVVFDKAFEVSNKNLPIFQSLLYEKQVSGNAIKFRILKDIESTAELKMVKDQNTWELKFINDVENKPLRVVSRPYAAPQPRVEIEFYKPEISIQTLDDEVVGDQVVVITTTESLNSIQQLYNFVDFGLPKTIQGGLIEKRSDTILVKKDQNIISIEGSTALNISPKQFKKSPQRFQEIANGVNNEAIITGGLKSYVKDNESITAKVLEFRRNLADAESTDQRLNIYVNWAIFYLANGMYKEGLAIIKLLAQEDQEFRQTYMVKFVEGVLNFMNHDYMKANTLLKSIDINDIAISQRKELRFWQLLSSYTVNESDYHANKVDPFSTYTENEMNFLTEYTDAFNIKFALIIGTQKIAVGDLEGIPKLIAKMPQIPPESHDINALFNMRAKYFIAKEEIKLAEDEWKLCIDNVSDVMNMTLCRYEQNEYLYDNQAIGPKKYAEELEKLILIWKGDSFEIKMLKKLGDVYFNQKEYINALKTWQKIVERFPFSPESVRLMQEMTKVFYDYFTDIDAKQDPFEASALFFEFERLVPIGPNGDEIVLKFVDYLIELDLLPRAISILNHQINFRLLGNMKEKAINKIAKVYLMNEQPDYAIEAMERGDFFEELPDHIGYERRYLFAQAYYKNNESEKALKMLQSIYSVEADDIRAEIYWQQQNWEGFARNAEPRIYQIRYSDDIISAKDAERVLRLAICYVISDKPDLLSKLIADFKNRLANDDKKSKMINELFDTLTFMQSNSLESLKNTKTLNDNLNKILGTLSGAK